jgi:hypothetical protein
MFRLIPFLNDDLISKHFFVKNIIYMYAFNLNSKIFKKYHMFRLIPFLSDDLISKKTKYI